MAASLQVLKLCMVLPMQLPMDEEGSNNSEGDLSENEMSQENQATEDDAL